MRFWNFSELFPEKDPHVFIRKLSKVLHFFWNSWYDSYFSDKFFCSITTHVTFHNILILGSKRGVLFCNTPVVVIIKIKIFRNFDKKNVRNPTKRVMNNISNSTIFRWKSSWQKYRFKWIEIYRPKYYDRVFS